MPKLAWSSQVLVHTKARKLQQLHDSQQQLKQLSGDD
jgi:hypothetical protein